MEPTLIYQKDSETLRQMPENYLIAGWHEGLGRWMCDPDVAADQELSTRVFLALFDFQTRYCRDGLELLSKVTPNAHFTKLKLKEAIETVRSAIKPTEDPEELRTYLNNMEVRNGVSGNLMVPGEQWLAEQFEYHYCDECGGDFEHHTAIPFNGNWFARCDYPKDEEGNYHPVIQKYREENCPNV